MGSRTERGVMRNRRLENTSEMDDRAASGWPTERSSSARCGGGWRQRGGFVLSACWCVSSSARALARLECLVGRCARVRDARDGGGETTRARWGHHSTPSPSEGTVAGSMCTRTRCRAPGRTVGPTQRARGAVAGVEKRVARARRGREGEGLLGCEGGRGTYAEDELWPGVEHGGLWVAWERCERPRVRRAEDGLSLSSSARPRAAPLSVKSLSLSS